MLLVLAIAAAILWVPSPWGLVLVVAAAVFEIAEAGFWLWLSKRRRPVAGAEALVGAEGHVVAACRPYGQVRVGGELWRARCDDGASVGEEIVVDGLEDNLTLRVRRL